MWKDPPVGRELKVPQQEQIKMAIEDTLAELP